MAKSLNELRDEARGCQDCPLWANATQTVFGAGDPHARVMLVGEQPGDEEDKKGLPFVGPAGRLLDRGRFVENPLARYVFATFHPSALLRLREEEEKEAAFEQLVKDLKLINKALERP
jgi:uracil-DNA glycosylase